MRLAATILCWLVATAALAVAVPAGWAQRNIIDDDGYAALARSAAHDPVLQSAMASELANRINSLAGGRGHSVALGVAGSYAASSSFPNQFADANRVAHRWLFTDAARQSDAGWEVDVAPMLADTSFKNTLNDLGVNLPQNVTVPVTSDSVQPGELRPMATWGPWVSIGASVLTAVATILTLVFARKRGKALAALGVSALLVGAGGWAAAEIMRDRIDTVLPTGDVHTIADVMLTQAEGSLHHWLNLTLAAGGALVVVGVIATVVGALRSKPPQSSATGTQRSEPI